MSGSRGWIFTNQHFKTTPSIQQGLTKEQEEKFRREAAKIVLEVGSLIRLKANPTLATAIVFMHRFYMFHSFTEFPRELTALGCLFLAGKVEETPKKCRDICNFAVGRFPSLYMKHKTLSDEIMGIERVLLQTLKFDLQVPMPILSCLEYGKLGCTVNVFYDNVDHPYSFIVNYVSLIEGFVPQDSLREVMQNAWTFANDSLSTTVCLQWEPPIVAIALMHLALKVKNLSTDQMWWNPVVANLTWDILENICHKVLDFYSASKNEKMDFMVDRPTQ